MRTVMQDAPQSLLDERRRQGLDVRDEVWEGVLHTVPPPTGWHQLFGTKLIAKLLPVAESKGFVASYETGLFRPRVGQWDYRVPDLVFAPLERYTRKGIEGPAAFVVEILSEDDESFEKLPFYASLGVREVVIVHPETRELRPFALREGRMQEVSADAEGRLHALTLDVRFIRIDGPKLRVTWPGGEAEI